MAIFEERSRSELLSEARGLNIERPERMTRVELRDAIIQRTVPESQQAEARGLFGVARSMLASVVETGLNLPDAAKVIRGDNNYEIPRGNQSPVATVTLAEIYAAQGHKARALRVLDDVLREEPDHEEARRVRAELSGNASSPCKSGRAVEGGEDPSEELTAAALPVADLAGETSDYTPGGFVETTGEAIETGQPPEVEEDSPEESAPPSDVTEAQGFESSVGAGSESQAQDDSEDGGKYEAPCDPALVLSQFEGILQLYWELPRAALERCGVDGAEGRAALKIVAFKASGAAPERAERMVPLTAEMRVSSDEDVDRGAGVLKLRDFAGGATVRAAIGWESDDAFLPLSVGRSLEEWGADRANRSLLARSDQALSGAIVTYEKS